MSGGSGSDMVKVSLGRRWAARLVFGLSIVSLPVIFNFLWRLQHAHRVWPFPATRQVGLVLLWALLDGVVIIVTLCLALWSFGIICVTYRWLWDMSFKAHPSSLQSRIKRWNQEWEGTI